MNKRRLYVLTRSDLSIEQQAVQSGHAVAEFTLKYPELWQNEYLIYLSVKNEDDIFKWSDKLERKNSPFAMFFEPDLNNEATSLAVVNDGNLFKKLNCLRAR